MKNRLPMALAVTALVVALLGSTGIAQAATASFALNAGRLLGFKPSKTSKKNTVVVRGKNGKIDAASIPAQARGARGLTGATGPVGPVGPPGTNGTNGTNGAQGPAGPFPSNLPSNKSLYGTFNVECDGTVCEGGNAHFTYALATAPTVHYIPVGGAVPAGCSGTVAAPAAASGHFCAFEGYRWDAAGTRGIINPATDIIGQGNRFGAAFYIIGTDEVNKYVGGVWVVTGSSGTPPASVPAAPLRTVN